MMHSKKQILQLSEDANDWISTILCLGMIAGFLWSRAMLSTSIILLFAHAILFLDIRSQFNSWKKDRFALACLLFFSVHLFSVLWSIDKTSWMTEMTNKLPFIILPFVFIGIPLYKLKYRQILIMGLLILQLVVIIQSLSTFLMNREFYIESYQVMKTLPTTKYNDHIRFSTSLVLSLLIILHVVFERNQISKLFKSICGIIGIIFIIYLHILAAKTGLLALYILIPLFIILKFFSKNKSLTITTLALIGLLPIMAYYTFSTFKRKIDNFRYEIRMTMEQDELNYNLSDQGRLISYQMAIDVFHENPIFGVGLGDIRNEVKKSYSKLRPDIPDERILIPHNQFLFTLVSVGVVFSISLLWMIWTATAQIRIQRIYPIITSIIMISAFMVEAMLEIQFGIFVYLFFTLFWRQLNRHLETPPLHAK